MRDDAASDRRVVPLAGTDPDADREDLTPVATHLDGASVVGMGMATHGTRECFELCDRLTRTLVEAGDVRTVALETDPAATVPLDDYVARGEGDTTTALQALDDWMWSTAGLRSTAEWLRSFNEGRPPADRVRVRGVDLVPPAGGAECLLSLLPAVESVGADDLRPALADLADGTDAVDVDATPRADFEAAAGIASDVLQRLDPDDGRTDAATASVRHCCRAMERTLEWYDAVADLPERPHPRGMAVRDRTMAANVRGTLDSREGGVAVWAHQGHVQRGRFDDGTTWAEAETMGAVLADALGERYRCIGTDLTGGRVRAVDGRPDGGDPATLSLDDPGTATLAATLDPSQRPAAVLRGGPGPAGDDARTGWRVRYVGTVFDPDADPDAFVLETTADSFDAVLCLGETRPSRTLR